MAEPVKVYKDGKESVATSATGLKQMQADGWVTEEQADEEHPMLISNPDPKFPDEDLKPGEAIPAIVKPAPKKRGRPKKAVTTDSE